MNLEEIKEKIKEVWDEIDYYFWNIRSFFIRLRERILGNIELLIFFNKTCSYRNWDFCYLYYYIEWKLQRMRDTILSNNIIADSDAKTIKEQIDEALGYLHTYFYSEDEVEKPEWMNESGWWLGESMTPEREEESRNYYMAIYNKEREAWDNFHECLKKYAENWWD